MRFDGLVRTLPEFDYSRIKSAVLGMNPEHWGVDTLRQSTYPVHQLTKTLRILWLDNKWSPKDERIIERVFTADKEVVDSCMELAHHLEGHFNGKAVKLLVSLLPNGAKIGKHWDSSFVFQASHRCHLPIITNENVEFFLDGERHHLQEGKLVEINNQSYHYVENNGLDRVHVICDVMEDEVFKSASDSVKDDMSWLESCQPYEPQKSHA